MSIANKSENSETPIKQCATDKFKESFWKELNPKSNARFLLSLSNATRNFWLVSRWMCRQKFMPKIAASTILALRDSHSARRESRSARRDSRRAGNET